jgi:hypothetical protein
MATNRLLECLTRKDRAHLLDHCEPVELTFPDVLAEPGDAMLHVYFPTASFISLVTLVGTDNLEVALAGNEGLYGVPVALGVATSPVHALVQGSGPAWRMEAGAFRRELARSAGLKTCINRYIYVLMSQLISTAGCNRFHVVEQRVARWLLMTADRAHAPTFRITHEFLAYMLGVRRVGITEAASALQRRGLIGYTRGVVTVVDRAGLERAACSCYRSDIATYKSTFARH